MKVLFLENNIADVCRLEGVIADSDDLTVNYEIELFSVNTLSEGVRMLKEEGFELALVSSYFGGTLASIPNFFCTLSTPVIILTDDYNLEYSLEMLRSGVLDCVTKTNLNRYNLGKIIVYAFERYQHIRCLKDLNQSLQNLSNTDSLTSLHNRRGLANSLDKMQKLRSRKINPVTAILLDCDNFKQVNDSFGYNIGDKVLRGLSEILKNRLRETDIVARIGGDEFLVLLFGSNLENGIRIGEELKSLVMRSELYKKFSVTVSGAVLEINLDKESGIIDKILEKGSAGIKCSKLRGKNCICPIK